LIGVSVFSVGTSVAATLKPGGRFNC
jgi:hypothetical protein